MRNVANICVLWGVLHAFSLSSIADSNAISPGDYLFIKAEVINCGDDPLYVEASKVAENRRVTFFKDIELETEGKTLEELTSEFVASWKDRTGQNSKTIQIMRVPADDPERAAKLMMVVYQERKNCGQFPDRDLPEPDWQGHFQIAGSQCTSSERVPA